MAEWDYTTTSSVSTWTTDTTSTASFTLYSTTYSDWPTTPTAVQTFLERLYDKGKFFEFISSREFRDWFRPPVIPKKKFKERNGFQQMCRLPCYRGVRTR